MSPTRTQRTLRVVTVVLLVVVLVAIGYSISRISDLDKDDKLIARSDAVTYCVGNLGDTRAETQLRATDAQLDSNEQILNALVALVAENNEDLVTAIRDAAGAIADGRAEVAYGLDVSDLMTDTRQAAAELDPDPDSEAGKFTCPGTPPRP